MANMNWENIKERNGREDAEVPDLKLTGIFLFDDEPDDAQGHYVTDIFTLGGVKDRIYIQYCPEWTPVRNESMYVYGTKKNSHKKSLSLIIFFIYTHRNQ
ncbi:MAG: hypothetical protein KatS3mg035_1062 [Bacteroidia bacterium]|nr:MAG: hypothetical protein KatS3mg035_1062 [Bacteroidia bacterium]